jgi:hypothetical protein
MNFPAKRLDKWRENTFFISLVIAVVIFPFSEGLVSISAGWLLFQALVLRSWLHPSFKSKTSAGLFFLFSVFGIYMIGSLFTNDFSFALYEFRKVIFWVVIPLAVFLSPKLPDRKVYLVLKAFILSVTLSSLILTSRLLLHNYFQLDGVRSVGFISHIRFSFQVVLSLIILAWFFFRKDTAEHRRIKFLYPAVFLWLTYFLFLLQSLLGIISFFGTLGLTLLYYIAALSNKKWKLILGAGLILLISVPSFFLWEVISDFYDFHELDPETVDFITPSGNNYEFDFENGMRENGHLVYAYICHDEMRREWNNRSSIDYDDQLNGYPLNITLIRYLASLGYRRDSAGVASLSARDVELIEEGVTNYKFSNRFLSIYPRIYETIWEIDNYFRSGDPNDKSLAQRIEFIKASLILIRENPWFGIGTGNWVQKYNEVYDKMETKLDKEKRASSHNQYLNYMVKFGLTGFLWIFTAILFPFFRNGHYRNFIFVLFVISYAFANLGDANLETHMGLSFFTFFYSFLYWNSTEIMSKSLRKS